MLDYRAGFSQRYCNSPVIVCHTSTEKAETLFSEIVLSRLVKIFCHENGAIILAILCVLCSEQIYKAYFRMVNLKGIQSSL